MMTPRILLKPFAVNRYIRPAHLRRALDELPADQKRAGLDARFRPMLRDVARKACTADGNMVAYAVWLHPDRDDQPKADSGYARPADPTVDKEASKHFNSWLEEHDRRLIGARKRW